MHVLFQKLLFSQYLFSIRTHFILEKNEEKKLTIRKNKFLRNIWNDLFHLFFSFFFAKSSKFDHTRESLLAKINSFKVGSQLRFNNKNTTKKVVKYVQSGQ